MRLNGRLTSIGCGDTVFFQYSGLVSSDLCGGMVFNPLNTPSLIGAGKAPSDRVSRDICKILVGYLELDTYKWKVP